MRRFLRIVVNIIAEIINEIDITGMNKKLLFVLKSKPKVDAIDFDILVKPSNNVTQRIMHINTLENQPFRCVRPIIFSSLITEIYGFLKIFSIFASRTPL